MSSSEKVKNKVSGQDLNSTGLTAITCTMPLHHEDVVIRKENVCYFNVNMQ